MDTAARIVADSINEDGSRLTTFETRFHRFVLPELNTHCTLVKSSASSRAIPVPKQLARLIDDPTRPLSWPLERSGMQGGEELTDEALAEAIAGWDGAMGAAIGYARHLHEEVGLHKSVTNRLIEPFMSHTAVLTGTAFENFFALRTNPLAQPELRAAAVLMEEAYRASTPVLRGPGEWHLPYVEAADWELPSPTGEPLELLMPKISVARTARVSYLTQDGRRDLAADLGLYARLISAEPAHAAPLEHVARPDLTNQHWVDISSESEPEFLIHLPRYGRLLGWRAHRFDLESAKRYQSFS